ncbi:tetratricopeptide repeat protein [Candidatus Woesearchaeota archaeon]|nr:tetratricopeptide repeat protein [Candidatus Woesearchaeota archaeon]
MKKNQLFMLIIVLLSFISYGNILFNGLVWDDERFIIDRPETRQIGSTLNYFTEDFFQLYRPVRELFYYLAFKSFDLNPLPYHLFSIILHALASVMIFLIIAKLFNEKLGFFAAALFAVHPIHVGRVANATASFDIIGLIFYLLSFYLYVRFRDSNRRSFLVSSIIVFVLGLLSSEELFTLPLLIGLYEFVFRRKSMNYKATSPYFIFLALFLFWRIIILQISARVGAYPGGSAFVSFLTMPKVLLEYIFLVVWPVQLSPFRGVDFVSVLFSPLFLIPLIILIAIIRYIYVKRHSDKVLFFVGFFIITMLPFLNITPLTKIMAERYFYLASLSIIVGIASLIFLLKKKWHYPVLIILLIVFSGLTVWQNTFWKDDFNLMTRGVEINPDSSRAHNNLGNYYFNLGQLNRAFTHFRESVRSDPSNHRAWVNLGVYFTAVEDYNNSLNALRTALRLTPENYNAYEKLGNAYAGLGEYDKALDAYGSSIQLNPDYYKAYARLGSLFGNSGNLTVAKGFLERAIELNPYYAEPYFNLGILYEKVGEMSTAQQYYKVAAQLDPDNRQYASKVR